jgi:hypothetical protein
MSGVGAATQRPVGRAREVGIEPAVVVDHHHAVAAHADVELEGRDAECERALESGQRVLGRVAARAAVALDIERSFVG